MKSRIDTFNDSTFKEIVSSSSTWKELAERLLRRYLRTKGELFTTLKNWQTARTAIRKAVADFDDGTLVSEINNLIALCPNHHWEYDNGLLEL